MLPLQRRLAAERGSARRDLLPAFDEAAEAAPFAPLRELERDLRRAAALRQKEAWRAAHGLSPTMQAVETVAYDVHGEPIVAPRE